VQCLFYDSLRLPRGHGTGTAPLHLDGGHGSDRWACTASQNWLGLSAFFLLTRFMLPASSTCRKCTDGYLTTRQHSCAECGDMLYLLKASGILIFESIQQHSDFCSKVPRLAAARLAAERAEAPQRNSRPQPRRCKGHLTCPRRRPHGARAPSHPPSSLALTGWARRPSGRPSSSRWAPACGARRAGPPWAGAPRGRRCRAACRAPQKNPPAASPPPRPGPRSGPPQAPGTAPRRRGHAVPTSQTPARGACRLRHGIAAAACLTGVSSDTTCCAPGRNNQAHACGCV